MLSTAESQEAVNLSVKRGANAFPEPMQTFQRKEASLLKSEQFELWFQPVYEVPNGDVLHNEILLRQRTPSGKLLSPKDFMPEIFESEQEHSLDRFVIRNAVSVLADKPTSKLSVNLSRRAAQDFEIANLIHDLTSEFCISPDRLNIELSEKNIAGDLSSYISLIKDLKDIGCKVVLDNFANDYLTFMQWEALNVDSVKVRGDLIRQSAQDAHAKRLVRSIVASGASMNQPAIAKSIDAIAASIFSEKLRFDSVQGYYLKPPSPDVWMNGKIEILGVSIDNLSMDEVLAQLDKGTIFTPNVDHVINARKSEVFGEAYNSADYKLCDSQILYFASWFLGHPLKQKISGSDLFPAFYQHHKNDLNTSIFLLGGMEDTPLMAQANINRKVGRPMVVGAYSPPLGFDEDDEISSQIVDRINRSGATVLAIGVGSPKQENWISKYRQDLKFVKIIFAIGATIDFEAGVVPRAPQIVSQIGAEWLYRLSVEPKRLWKRYLINDLPFIWLLLKQRMFG